MTNIPIRIHTLCALLTLTLLSSCQGTNIRQVVKEATEAKVDTTGMARQELALSPFSAMSVNCFADVTYHPQAQATEPRLELCAPEAVLPNIVVRVAGDELQITTSPGYIMPEKAVVVAELWAPGVSRLRLCGGKCLRLSGVELTCPLSLELVGVSSLQGEGVRAPEVDVHIKGAASARLTALSTARLRLEADGEATIELGGEIGHLDKRLRGGATLAVR